MIAMRWCAAVLIGIGGAGLVAGCAFFTSLGMELWLKLPRFTELTVLGLLFAFAGAGVGCICGQVCPLDAPRPNAWWITGAALGTAAGFFGEYWGTYVCLL